MNDDTPQDQLISHGEMHGWRLEVWKPGFWLDTYDYRIRPIPRSGDPVDEESPFGGFGFRSVQDAKSAALEDFQQKMRLGHLKPRHARASGFQGRRPSP